MFYDTWSVEQNKILCDNGFGSVVFRAKQKRFIIICEFPNENFP